MTRLRLILPVTALALAWSPIPPRLVERDYSLGIYRVIQPVMTSFSNLVPIALFDLALAVILAVWVGRAAIDLVRLGARKGAGRILLRTGVWVAAVYVAFLCTWGFNYRRVRLRDRLPFDASQVSDQSAGRLFATTVDRLNALYPEAHSRMDADESVALAKALDAVMGDLGVAREVVVARPKRTWVQWYFARSGVDGMTDPIFLETLVNSELLPFERPFVIAHEWSHLAGLADEGEASYGGWLACMRAGVPEQYSGWLFLYGELAAAVPPQSARAASAKLLPGPRDDLRAIHARIARSMSPVMSTASWRLYDTYLKANHVQAGARSYREVVQLVLGVRLSALSSQLPASSASSSIRNDRTCWLTADSRSLIAHGFPPTGAMARIVSACGSPS